jgi:hypothetical protein
LVERRTILIGISINNFSGAVDAFCLRARAGAPRLKVVILDRRLGRCGTGRLFGVEYLARRLAAGVYPILDRPSAVSTRDRHGNPLPQTRGWRGAVAL